jgi:hypothetical protein
VAGPDDDDRLCHSCSVSFLGRTRRAAGDTVLFIYGRISALHSRPPAIQQGSGRVPVRDMMRAGFWVNILGWGVIIAVSAVTLPWIA